MENNMEFEILETSGKNVKLTIRNPVIEDWDEADKVYATKIAELLRDKSDRRLFTRPELEKMLDEQKIWTEDDQKRITALNKEIMQIIKQLKKGGIKLKEGRELCLQITEKRNEVVNISKKKQLFDDSTAESMAEREKLDYLIYVTTVYSDTGKNYWSSFEDMKNDRASKAYAEASRNAIKAIYNYDPEYEKHLPENKWLQKFGFINDNLEYVDRKTGARTDKFGRPISEVEQEVVEFVEMLQGDIESETPFIDDETNEPVFPITKVDSSVKTETEVKPEATQV